MSRRGFSETIRITQPAQPLYGGHEAWDRLTWHWLVSAVAAPMISQISPSPMAIGMLGCLTTVSTGSGRAAFLRALEHSSLFTCLLHGTGTHLRVAGSHRQRQQKA